MTKRQIHARLIERGSSVRAWSLAHGYKPRTVTMVLERWAGRAEQPQGRLSFRILRDLSRDLGREIVPGCLREAA
jgi:hypothetical protein